MAKAANEKIAEIRTLDEAELDAASGGSIVDTVVEIGQAIWNTLIISPRDPSSDLPTGQRTH